VPRKYPNPIARKNRSCAQDKDYPKNSRSIENLTDREKDVEQTWPERRVEASFSEFVDSDSSPRESVP
jgi:hypothetical protein